MHFARMWTRGTGEALRAEFGHWGGEETERNFLPSLSASVNKVCTQALAKIRTPLNRCNRNELKEAKDVINENYLSIMHE